jgi:hypothetical protein
MADNRFLSVAVRSHAHVPCNKTYNNMNKEEIIRNEASEFAENKLESNVQNHQGHKKFRDLLIEEVNNFYQPDAKMIFLDQMKLEVKNNWEEHKANCPKTQNGEECPRDTIYTKILFYIQQEIDELPQIVRTNQSESKSVRDKVFISYSHYDKEWLDKFRRHFRPFENKIEFWDDNKIKAGQKWKQEIKSAISHTKIAVLLISADFFNSDFIVNHELPPLLKAAQEDGATILSVILKPCMFDEYPEISQYQAINSPLNTVLQMDEATQEITWVELVKTIKKLINTKDELVFELKNGDTRTIENKFFGDGNYLYSLAFTLKDIGYDGAKLKIKYDKNLSDGAFETVDERGFGVNINQKRNLSFIDWDIELKSIFKDEEKVEIKLTKR